MFFIDDQPLNIEGARACGMNGYCFLEGSAEDLKKVIIEVLHISE